MPDFVADYEETSTTALSVDPAVAVPLLTIKTLYDPAYIVLMCHRETTHSLAFY